jgi:hypothetical protein
MARPSWNANLRPREFIDYRLEKPSFGEANSRLGRGVFMLCRLSAAPLGLSCLNDHESDATISKGRVAREGISDGINKCKRR